MRGTKWPATEIERALRLVLGGVSDYEVARQTGIPRSTVLNWRTGKVSAARAEGSCAACGQPRHDCARLPAADYAYLLGQYLGDGTVFRTGPYGRGLRIASDAQYAGIISECCLAIERIRGRAPYVRYHRDRRLATITSYGKEWPCLLPQHGLGRKHQRTMALVGWQVEIVEAQPGRFIRGLIHSDGWRGLNRVRVKGRDYAYPRYQFSNRSEDIKALFTYACELLGVAWRPWGRFHISVAKREAVEILDRVVGPKY